MFCLIKQKSILPYIKQNGQTTCFLVVFAICGVKAESDLNVSAICGEEWTWS